MSSPHLAVASGVERGLLCGFHIPSVAEAAIDVAPEDIARAVAAASGVTWLHFNLSNARARQLIAETEGFPELVRDALCTHDVRRRVENVDDGLIVVMSDLTYEDGSEPEDTAMLWAYVSDRLLVTGRTHPLQTVDKLRAAVKAGMRAESGWELLLWIMNQRTASLRSLTAEMADQVGDIEEQVLSGRIREQREQLGRIRRFCAQLRRHIGPDRVAFRRLLQTSPAPGGERNAAALRFELDEVGVLMEEVLELYERSKLLQEELASRVAENTGRTLYVLAVLSAVFLPMTLITGIFGMNVQDLPGMHSGGAFWWVMLLILAAGAVTLAFIFRRERR
jgi:zinc transporter